MTETQNGGRDALPPGTSATRLDRPGDRLLEAVVAPEQFAVPGDETRRAEDAFAGRLDGGVAERLFRPVCLRRGLRRDRIAAGLDHAGGEHAGVGDIDVAHEVGAVD